MRLSIIAVASCTALLAASRIASAALTNEPLRISAPHPVPTTVASQPGPVHLDGCFSDTRAGDGLTLVHHAVRITNGGDRAISGVRVKFAFYDVFGDVSGMRTNIAEARIDPGQLVDRINLTELADSAPPAKIVCSIDAVRYIDGTVVRT